jgi:hypothetical protein
MHVMQPSKFGLNALSWQILETRNLGCYTLLNPAKFLADNLRPVPEPFSTGWALSVELWVVSP